MRRFSLPLLLSIACCLALVSAVGASSPVGPRSAAMADAFVGFAGGLEGVFWNPAGVAGQPGREVGGFAPMSGLDPDSPSFFLGYATPDEGVGAAAAWWRRDSQTLPGGEILTTDSLAYSYGKRLLKTVSAGATLRLQYEQLSFPNTIFDPVESTGYGLDLGLLWEATPQLTAGIAFKDVNGTPLTDDSGLTSETPMEVRAGLSYRLNPQTLINLDLIDVTDSAGSGRGLAGGIERSLNQKVQLRAGVAETEGALTLSGGVGYVTPRLRVDIAVTSTDNSAKTIAGLTYRF